MTTRFKIGDRLRNINAPYLPTAAVTEITERGFRYVLDRPVVISPRLGTQVGGESYMDEQWEPVAATPSTEAQKCVEYHHDQDVDKDGICRGYVVASGSNFLPCLCKCTFPATVQGESARELIEKVYDRYPTAYRGEEERTALINAITTFTTAHGEERWREGLLRAAKEVCDACDNEAKYGLAHKVEGSSRWWHGDDNVPCEAGGIHALLAAAGGSKWLRESC